jgi:integrase
MENQNEIDDLISGALECLKSQLSVADITVVRYKRRWLKVKLYMIEHGFDNLTDDVVGHVLANKFQGRKLTAINKYERLFYHDFRILNNFQKEGILNIDCYLRKDPVEFTGGLAGPINDFLLYRKNEHRLSDKTVSLSRYYLQIFNCYCCEKNIESVSDINSSVILLFLSNLESKIKISSSRMIATLRSFIKYLYDHKLIEHLYRVPRYKAVNQPELPTVYSESEVQKLIVSIDRGTRVGKRDYAIVLIAAKLGLRASDISLLKFQDLNWETNSILINQYKTGADITHPLLPTIGNAIIEYLKYARPKSLVPELFVTEKPPYAKPLTSHSVSEVIRRAFKRSGITIGDRKSGSHSLRHSLVSRMLEGKTVLPIISAVLGHKNSESSKYYMRIDLTAMKQCVLEVPPVPTEFYKQKGGTFYA